MYGGDGDIPICQRADIGPTLGDPSGQISDCPEVRVSTRVFAPVESVMVNAQSQPCDLNSSEFILAVDDYGMITGLLSVCKCLFAMGSSKSLKLIYTDK